MPDDEKIDGVDERLLNLLISRVTARESASLALVTISSSASLVFLGFAINEITNWFIPIIGIIFPALGIAYFELTSLTIHRHDHCQIRKLMLKNVKDEREGERVKKIILFREHQKKRGLLSRLLLFSPIIVWLVITLTTFTDDFSKCLSIIGIIISVLAIGLLTKENELPTNEDECKDD